MSGVFRAICRLRLAFEQRLFSFDAPVIPAEAGSAGNDTVTRNQDADGIRGARACHGTRGGGSSDPSSDLPVRAGLAARNPLELLPDFHLKRGTPDIYRNLFRGGAAGDHRDDALHPTLHFRITGGNGGAGELVGQQRDERVIARSKLHRAHPLRRRGNQDTTDGRISADKSHGCSLPARGVFRRRHSKRARRTFVDAAGGTEPGFVNGFRHGVLLLQGAAKGRQSMRVGEFTWREAQHLGKGPLQVRGARADGGSQFRQRYPSVLGVFRHAGPGPQRPIDQAGGNGRPRTTAPTCPIPGPLGLSGIGKERDPFPAWLAARAGRAAIDAGGGHRVHECPVSTPVAHENGLPLRVDCHEPIVVRAFRYRYPDLAVELTGTQVAMGADMDSTSPLSAQLDRLAQFEGTTAPFISLYLNAQPNDRGRDQFSVFLKQELRGRAATYDLETPARDSLDRDIQRIEAYVESELQPSANGVAIFACAAADDFFEALQLDAPIDEHRLFVSDRPHLYPLAQLDSRYPKCAAVLCDTNRARIFVVALARVEQEHEVIGTKTRRHSMGGWSQARYQRHIDNYHQQHVKEVVDTLARIVRDESIPHIALFGDAVAIPMLQAEMPQNLRDLVIEESNLPTGSNPNVVLEKMLEVLDRHNAETDREKVEQLFNEYRSGGLGVVGLEAVKLALEVGQVDELLITGPGQPLEAPVIDQLVAQARQTSAQVTVIEAPELLAGVGGVGALLRFRVPGLQKSKTRPSVGAAS